MTTNNINSPRKKIYKHKTLWISDIHLGTKGCSADILLDFLKRNECETLYLVGDIFDGWRLKRSWYWPQSHNNVIQKILRKVRKGTRVIYIPGNHDEFLSKYVKMNFGGIDVYKNHIHETVDGKKLLIMHGHEFDHIVKFNKWLAVFGDYAYQFTQTMNVLLNRIRILLDKEYWSLSSYLKLKVKNAVNFISAFEDAVAEEAKKHNVDGIVCGHIHHAQIRNIDNIMYYNDGDWVESCTALSEDFDGNIEIIHWHEKKSETPLKVVA